MLLSFEEASELFSYNPDTGAIVSKTTIYKARISGNGYLRITAKKTSFLVHRIAWLLATGSLPEPPAEIDHRNGIKTDNRLCNLRVVSRTVNQRNQFKANSNSFSNLRNISYIADVKKFRVRVFADGKNHNIGYFPTVEEAIAARDKALTKLHFSS